MRKYTRIFYLIGIGVCILHFFDLDKKNIIFASFSIPLWFIHAFYDVRNVNIFIIYLLTILTWALLGYILDKLVQLSRANRL
jgi:hypothetical protein